MERDFDFIGDAIVMEFEQDYIEKMQGKLLIANIYILNFASEVYLKRVHGNWVDLDIPNNKKYEVQKRSLMKFNAKLFFLLRDP